MFCGLNLIANLSDGLKIMDPCFITCDKIGKLLFVKAGPRSAIGRAPDSYVRGPGFDTRPGNILSFLLPLFQEGQLSVRGQ